MVRQVKVIGEVIQCDVTQPIDVSFECIETSNHTMSRMERTLEKSIGKTIERRLNLSQHGALNISGSGSISFALSAAGVMAGLSASTTVSLEKTSGTENNFMKSEVGSNSDRMFFYISPRHVHRASITTTQQDTHYVIHAQIEYTTAFGKHTGSSGNGTYSITSRETRARFEEDPILEQNVVWAKLPIASLAIGAMMIVVAFLYLYFNQKMPECEFSQ